MGNSLVKKTPNSSNSNNVFNLNNNGNLNNNNNANNSLGFALGFYIDTGQTE